MNAGHSTLGVAVTTCDDVLATTLVDGATTATSIEIATPTGTIEGAPSTASCRPRSPDGIEMWGTGNVRAAVNADVMPLEWLPRA